MPILIRNIPLSLHEPVEVLRAKAARRLRVPADAVRLWSPVRRSLDARPGRGDEPIRWVYNIELALDGGLAAERRRVGRLGRGDVAMLEPKRLPVLEPGRVPLTRGPVVVGFGPAGMFAGLLLAEMGYRPVVLERGRDVARRDRDVERFWAGGGFEPNSNLLFGEGGAGCYSDGKLYARGHDPRRAQVLETFYRFGADPDILIDGRPHVGSDRLPGICRRLREAIASAGGEVRFEQRVTGFEVADGRLAALRLAGGERMPVGPVILGVGHSARDTLTALASAGVELAAKGFQMGLRIEHPQAVVNAWQYGAMADDPRLPPAEYQLVARGAAADRGDAFSFCMCPGGTVLPANESAGLIAVNGASREARDGAFANSGLVVTVRPDDVGSTGDALAGLAFQQRYERRAFALGGGGHAAPLQRAADFVAGRPSDGAVRTSYPLGGRWADLREVLPPPVADALRRALALLDRRMPGFGGPDAILTGPESRASCPLRIVRDPDTRQSPAAAGLFPVGEGAGYAGGIVSAAIDGMRSAEWIVRYYARPA